MADTYGELLPGETIRSKRYKVAWQKIPQPVQLHFHVLRALKDKLPKGQYVILVTLYDRLGGHPLKWSVIGEHGAGKDRPGVTKPIRHRGCFYHTELNIEQTIYAVCPAAIDLRPGMLNIDKNC